MPVSNAAMWLNDFFAGYDHAILSLMHSLASGLGSVLTPLMSLITILGEKGLVFFLLTFLFLLFADTRDTGVCVFGAVCCGALITNIILKDSVARPRPFQSSDEYYAWWQFIGARPEDGFSFPSGHVTACAAGMTALCNMKGKKLVLPSVIIVLLMAIARNYLMAHYPSDVLVAAIIGVFSGFVAWFITQFIFHFLRRNRNIPLFDLILDFDIREILPSGFTSGEGIIAFFRDLGSHIRGLASRRPRQPEKVGEKTADSDEAAVRKPSVKRRPAAKAPAAVGRHEIRPPVEVLEAEEEKEPVRRGFSVNDLADVLPASEPSPAESKAVPRSVPAASRRSPAPKLRVGSYKGKHEL